MKPGEGDFEIPFIRQYLTNLRHFYGIEIRESASRSIEFKLRQLKMENIQVCFIALLHMLYKNVLQFVYKTAHQQILHSEKKGY